MLSYSVSPEAEPLEVAIPAPLRQLLSSLIAARYEYKREEHTWVIGNMHDCPAKDWRHFIGSLSLVGDNSGGLVRSVRRHEVSRINVGGLR